jgi:hypothetical protein
MLSLGNALFLNEKIFVSQSKCSSVVIRQHRQAQSFSVSAFQTSLRCPNFLSFAVEDFRVQLNDTPEREATDRTTPKFEKYFLVGATNSLDSNHGTRKECTCGSTRGPNRLDP